MEALFLGITTTEQGIEIWERAGNRPVQKDFDGLGVVVLEADGTFAPFGQIAAERFDKVLGSFAEG